MHVIVAGGAIMTLAACDPMPAAAIAAWRGPDPALTDARLRALSWALLAPNPHNQQPWRADIRQRDSILLHIDAVRLLPETDPHGRQILIGCGAFLELLGMAFAAEGWRAGIELMPAGHYDQRALDARPFARVHLSRAASPEPDPLFTHLLQRRTTRGPYGDAAPGTTELAQLARAAQRPGVMLRSSTDRQKVQRIGALAIAGINTEFRNQATWAESVRLLRFGAAAVAAEPSGLTFVGTKFWLLRHLGMLAPEKLIDARGTGPDQVIADMSAAVHSTRAWLWLESTDNSRQTQLETGRAYVRVGLAAAAAGLALHPQSQVLQEFAQMDSWFAQIHHELDVHGEGRVQMLVRVGYADFPPPSPRRRLVEFLVQTAINTDAGQHRVLSRC
ncbi:Acg family FMN-binding oxidoreductase [Massilia antarctica]|uniref:Acg family FMN-binding oxidoreductase n=1 Tax=Massilia antarctica TaxID=2765360 RepID=UPI00227205F6|nr:hypothetical protein [Massilia sp. H27-R4]MCY0916330.1 hypothetical protein [Massilia sp. H27-R4]